MNARLVCSLCREGRYEDAARVASVPSNVRRWRQHVSTVWQCSNCGSLHSLEQVDLGPFYRDYPYGHRQLDDFTRRVFGKYLGRLRQHGLKPADSLLDYGCSQGLFLDFLQEKGYHHCAGYDAYAPRYNDPAVLGRQYDAVVCQDVVEHVEDPQGLLDELARCTAPGGMLCLGTPRADDIDLADIGRSLHSLHQPFHLHILSERVLHDMCAKAGLVCEALYHRHSCDTPFPFVNWRFLKGYLEAIDNTLDAGFDPPRIGMVATSPRLLFEGLAGYWLPSRSEMIAILRKPA